MTTDIFYITFDMSFIIVMIYRMQIKNKNNKNRQTSYVLRNLSSNSIITNLHIFLSLSYSFVFVAGWWMPNS